jgi:hypothetical protein
LLEEFRVLGGTADNVCVRAGSLGKGLFAEDPSRPVRLRTPENLLLPLEDARFEGGKFFVAPHSAMPEREKAWFEHYENEFSWGNGGCRDTEAWLESIWSLPDDIRQTLAAKFGMAYCAGALTAEIVQQRFLDSRVITFNGRKVVMPIIELINHRSRAANYNLDGGVTVSGTFTDEILVSYSENDAFGLFQNWGFLSEEAAAYSLAMDLAGLTPEVFIARAFLKGKSHSLKDAPGNSVWLPELVDDEGRIRLSFLMLGNRNSPRIPRGAYHRVFRDTGLQAGDEVFDIIRHMNAKNFLDLLADIEGLTMPFATTLRTMCRYQLEALTFCFGMREI